MENRPLCRNFDDLDTPTMGAGGCRKQSDPRFLMDFTDVEPGTYIHWCEDCGPKAHAMNELLQEAFATRGPEFAQELEAAIDNVQRDNLH